MNSIIVREAKELAESKVYSQRNYYVSIKIMISNNIIEISTISYTSHASTLQDPPPPPPPPPRI